MFDELPNDKDVHLKVSLLEKLRQTEILHNIKDNLEEYQEIGIIPESKMIEEKLFCVVVLILVDLFMEDMIIIKNKEKK